MITNFSLLTELFRGFHIQRWNDRVRPMDMLEMDKHAHKMMIAYCLGKYEEKEGNIIKWHDLIKSGIFELFRRIVISDIKSPIYHEVKKRRNVFEKLNEFVFDQLEAKIDNELLKKELKEFLFIRKSDTDVTNRVLDAAHIYASYWEFQIIRQANPFHYQNTRIETELLNKIDQYKDLIGIKKLTTKHTVSNFVDLCGQLRFQVRWAQVPRVPKTAVLGHTMLVAAISYLFSRENEACDRRIYNNFFGGLFHDLPETVTRDIISPVKRSSKEFDNLITELEQHLAEDEIFPLIEDDWKDEIKYFIIDEFDNKIENEGEIINTITTNDINQNYNLDKYNPLDGKLIRAADHLAAFLEAYSSINSGVKSEELLSAAQNIKNHYKSKVYGNVSLKTLYSGFKLN